MYKFLFTILSISIFIAGCGEEPTPKEKSLAEMRAKLQASHYHRFDNTEPTKHNIHAPVFSSYEYKGKKLSLEEANKWEKIRVSKKEYQFWAELELTPKEAQDWKNINISLAAIKVFNQINYTPNKAKKFLKRNFISRPTFYSQFGTPVYEFDAICESIVQREQAPFAFLEDKCIPYMQKSHKNEIMGHLLDKSGVKKGPLALEYISVLRELENSIHTIQSGMEVTIEEFIEDEDTENFVFLFPLLQNEPLQEEMTFIDTFKLPLTSDERFFSFNNPEYWTRRAEAEDAAKKAAAMQVALLKAKKQSEQKAAELRLKQAEDKSKAKAQAQKKYRQEKLKKKRYAAVKEEQLKRKKQKEKEEQSKLANAKKSCGTLIEPNQYSAKQVFIGGEVIFTVRNPGNRMFGYGVISAYDKHIYFIRDPKNLAKASLYDKVVWNLKTMGRTEALSSISEDKFKYDKKSKTKFTMALLLNECKVK